MSEVISPDDGWDWNQFFRTINSELDRAATNSDPEVTLVVCDGVVEQLRDAQKRPEIPVFAFGHAYARDFITRGNAKWRAPRRRSLAAIANFDSGIRILTDLVDELGEECPMAWRHHLAGAFASRGVAKRDAPGHGPLAAIDDFNETIRIWSALIEGLGDTCESAPRDGLAAAFMARGFCKRRAPGHGPLAAIEDYDRGIRTWSALVEALGEKCSPAWRNSLATAFITRGDAKQDASGYGPLAAIEDYDKAILIRSTLVETLGEKCPPDWRNDLATAFTNRGIAKQIAPGCGPLPAIADYDKATLIQSTLVETLGEKCDPAWRNDLAITLSNRGTAKHDAPGHGPLAAIEDYDKAISISSALAEALGEKRSPKWRIDLAIAFVNRGNAKCDAPGHGPLAAIKDYDVAISIRSALVEALGEKCNPAWRNDLAGAFTNRGTAKHDAPGHGPLAAIEDYDKAISISSALVAAFDDKCKPEWRRGLANTLLNRGNAKPDAPGYGSPSAIEDYDKAINVLSELVQDFGEKCPPDWRDSLACVLMNRGTAKQDAPGYGPLAAIKDYDGAISIRSALVEALGEKCPPYWRNGLASVLMNRGTAKPYAPGYGPLAAIKDYDRAISIRSALVEALGEKCPPDWRKGLAATFGNRGLAEQISGQIENAEEDFQAALVLFQDDYVRVGAPSWLRTSIQFAVLRMKQGQFDKAVETLKFGAAWRSEGFAAAITRSEQKDHLAYGAEIAALGAVLLTRLGHHDEALCFLENNRALLLKEAMLRHASALELRVGEVAARRISALIAEQLELRLMLDFANAASNRRETAPDTAALRSTLTETTRNLHAALAEIGPATLAPELSIEAMRALAPENGALVVPIASSFGTVVLLLTHGREIQALHLDDLNRYDVQAWAAELRDAERDAREREDAAPLTALIADHLPFYWDKLIGPIDSALRSLGLSADAPVTIVTQGAFDLLPLHAARRKHDGRMRHWIEDRVIRYAPSMAALEIMHRRRAERGRTPARLAGFFNATDDLPRTEDSELPALRALPWAASHDCNSFHTSSRARAMQLLRGRASFTHLHFAMHSAFDPLAPEESGLRFSDGVLSVAELLAIPARADLECVSLASCQSGQSDNAADECIGPVLAFIQAGAGAVLSALYVLSHESAAGLAPAIYRRLLKHRAGEPGYDLAHAVRDTFLDCLNHTESTEITPALLDCIALKAACG